MNDHVKGPGDFLPDEPSKAEEAIGMAAYDAVKALQQEYPGQINFIEAETLKAQIADLLTKLYEKQLVDDCPF